MKFDFFALIGRMKYIVRWSLMRNSERENIQEHSHMVAVIAHALGLIRRDVFGVDCSPERQAAIALFHDAGEILTGDLPTPIKYHSRKIKSAYDEVEALACSKLLATLPSELRPAYKDLFSAAEDSREYELVKAADKISAYIKCVEERKAGNREFASAEVSIRAALESNPLPEVRYFLDHFIDAFEKNLDELNTIED
ncbi:MAG: 5'-deoxynucleotidase [Oscillospiraceae bacterium]|nr:5'-deoxynucleotidase [Oscillospiraceae bacterium]